MFRSLNWAGDLVLAAVLTVHRYLGTLLVTIQLKTGIQTGNLHISHSLARAKALVPIRNLCNVNVLHIFPCVGNNGTLSIVFIPRSDNSLPSRACPGRYLSLHLVTALKELEHGTVLTGSAFGVRNHFQISRPRHHLKGKAWRGQVKEKREEPRRSGIQKAKNSDWLHAKWAGNTARWTGSLRNGLFPASSLWGS